jgi:hypothetical protein
VLISSGKLLHVYEEAKHDGQRLGRHLELDARSLAYTIEREIADQELRVQIKPAEHPPAIPTLDQDQLGSCTGNAGTYALSSLFGYSALQNVKLDGLGLTNYEATSNEKFAVMLYHEATIEDGLPGVYPPLDQGSTGLGVARALKKAGLVGGYLWATTVHGFGVLLQRQGVMLGTPWFNAWFEPDAHGFVDAGGWESSGIAGGHEIYVEALEAWDDHRPDQSVIRFHNSWGDGWSDHGRGRMRLSTYLTLRQQIDCKQLVAKQ